MLPPTEKNLPEPVRTMELQFESVIRLSNVAIRGRKFLGKKVFDEASGDKVTRATPPSRISVDTGMIYRRGGVLLNCMNMIRRNSLAQT